MFSFHCQILTLSMVCLFSLLGKQTTSWKKSSQLLETNFQKGRRYWAKIDELGVKWWMDDYMTWIDIFGNFPLGKIENVNFLNGEINLRKARGLGNLGDSVNILLVVSTLRLKLNVKPQNETLWAFFQYFLWCFWCEYLDKLLDIKAISATKCRQITVNKTDDISEINFIKKLQNFPSLFVERESNLTVYLRTTFSHSKHPASNVWLILSTWLKYVRSKDESFQKNKLPA